MLPHTFHSAIQRAWLCVCVRVSMYGWRISLQPGLAHLRSCVLRIMSYSALRTEQRQTAAAADNTHIYPRAHTSLYDCLLLLLLLLPFRCANRSLYEYKRAQVCPGSRWLCKHESAINLSCAFFHLQHSLTHTLTQKCVRTCMRVCNLMHFCTLPRIFDAPPNIPFDLLTNYTFEECYSRISERVTVVAAA